MERCTEHDLINCKCREPLATWMVKQFAESVSDRVARSSSWSPSDHSGRGDRGNSRPDRIGGLGKAGGD